MALATNGNWVSLFFCSKIHFLFSVQAGRGGIDKNPLTLESLKQVFENACLQRDCSEKNAIESEAK